MKSLIGARRPLAGLLAIALLGTAGSVKADEVYSQIVGAIAIDVPAESDLVLSFPFKRSASFRGSVASSDPSVLTLDNASFTANEFSSGFYVFIEEDSANSDNKIGRRYNVTANTDTTVTVDAGGDDLSSLVDAVISVREHWTLSSAFPSGFGFVQETQPGLRNIELIVPDAASVGGGLAVSKLYYFYDGAWRELSQPMGDSADDAVLAPGASFVVRNNSEEEVRSYFFGEVVDAPLAIPVVSNVSEEVDNFVSLERPLAITLDELIGDSGLGIEDVLGTGDQLLVYGMGTGQNKVPTAYEYVGGQWQVVGDTADAGSIEIQAEQGIAIKRAAGNGSGTWVNEWSLPSQQ